MLLKDLKTQASQIQQTYENLSNTQRMKVITENEDPVHRHTIYRMVRNDLHKASWYILFHRLLRESTYVMVEVQTTKSVYYPNQFESFYRFVTKDVNLQRE